MIQFNVKIVASITHNTQLQKMYKLTPFIDLRVGLFHSTGRSSDLSTSTLATVTTIREHRAEYISWFLIQLNYLIIQDIIHTKTRPRLSLDSCMEIKTV